MFLDVSTKEAPIKTQNALTVTSSSLPDMPHPTKDAELQQAQKPSMHRLDIQGLRGIAVLAVVAYHAHLPLPGGFVGVDMFFVISGWVVSSMVIRQVATKSFSLIDFYSRRIRRLIPMLSITNLATLALVAGGFFLAKRPGESAPPFRYRRAQGRSRPPPKNPPHPRQSAAARRQNLDAAERRFTGPRETRNR